MKMNSYELSRVWFDWCFENPEKVNPNHTAIYFFAIEHCNRLGWKSKFGFPSQMTMDALGIKKHQTYIKYFRDLVDWGFFILIQESRNQYSSNIISLNNAMPKNGNALDKAIITHTAKQTQSNGQSNSSIDKPINNKQITSELSNPLFDMAYYKSLGYDWKLSESVYSELDKFLAYRISSHKDAIRTPETLEAIIRRLRETAKTESDALYIIRNTIEKQAKNIIFELPKAEKYPVQETKKYKKL